MGITRSLSGEPSYYGRQRYDSILVELEGYKANSVGAVGVKSKFSKGDREAIVAHADKALSFFRIPALRKIAAE